MMICVNTFQIYTYIHVFHKEGTPKPLLEAMGCGVPVITTDVGVVNEALGLEGKQFILGKRIIGINDSQIKEKLKEKIIYLYNNKDLLKILSNENYENSKKFEIGEIKQKFDTYFENFINN